MFKNFLYSLLILSFLLPTISKAQTSPNTCYNTSWPVHRYSHPKSGDTIIYKTPADYKITATNLSCVLVTEFIARASDMPDRMLVGLAREDGRQAFFARWAIRGSFTLVEVTIPENEYTGLGLFTVYPQPLSRIKEIITTKRFPTQEELPVHLRHKFKINNVSTSIFQILSLFGESHD